MATVGQFVLWNNTAETQVTEASGTGIATAFDGVYAPMPMARIDVARNLVDDTSNQPIFPTGANALQVVAGMMYRFRAGYYLSKGANVVNARPLFLGTATFTSFSFDATGFIVLNPNVNTTEGNSRHSTPTVNSPFNVVASAAALNQTIKLEGLFEVLAGGTVIPAINWSAATGATPTVLVDTYFECWPIGMNPVTTIGPWS